MSCLPQPVSERENLLPCAQKPSPQEPRRRTIGSVEGSLLESSAAARQDCWARAETKAQDHQASRPSPKTDVGLQSDLGGTFHLASLHLASPGVVHSCMNPRDYRSAWGLVLELEGEVVKSRFLCALASRRPGTAARPSRPWRENCLFPTSPASPGFQALPGQ